MNDRYEFISLLGTGGFGETTLARDLETGEEVVLKRLNLKSAEDWKSIELFQREAEVLQTLEHPFIPTYLDFFETEADDRLQLCLVQERAPGLSLQEKVVDGWRAEEPEKLLRSILETLVYLQRRDPPIVHRDIKPANIVVDDELNTYLVDFGAVSQVITNSIGGSTFIGTIGYMAPEQQIGRVTMNTDLYGTAVSMVFAATGLSPDTMPRQRLKVDIGEMGFSERVHICLTRMLETAPEDRIASASEALDLLNRPSQVARGDGDDDPYAVLVQESRRRLSLDAEYHEPTALLDVRAHETEPNVDSTTLQTISNKANALRRGMFWSEAMVPILLTLIVFGEGQPAMVFISAAIIFTLKILQTWGAKPLARLTEKRDVIELTGKDLSTTTIANDRINIKSYDTRTGLVSVGRIGPPPEAKFGIWAPAITLALTVEWLMFNFMGHYLTAFLLFGSYGILTFLEILFDRKDEGFGFEMDRQSIRLVRNGETVQFIPTQDAKLHVKEFRRNAKANFSLVATGPGRPEMTLISFGPNIDQVNTNLVYFLVQHLEKLKQVEFDFSEETVLDTSERSDEEREAELLSLKEIMAQKKAR